MSGPMLAPSGVVSDDNYNCEAVVCFGLGAFNIDLGRAVLIFYAIG